MASDVYLVGLGATVSGGSTGNIVARMTQNKALSVSITEEGGHDLTREGKRFILGIVGAITGQAPIQTLGLQVAAFGISNVSTTQTMFIDAIGMVLESGTAGTTGNCVYASHYTAPVSSGTFAGTGVVNANGGTTTSTALAMEVAKTITTPAASVWFPVAWDSQVASAIGSCSLVNDHVRGRLCIQPGKSLGLQTVGATGTTPLFAPYLSWTEESSSNG
jgi:hypothetical protein